MSKHALVTGGAGGLGLHLVRRLLKDGHQVTVVDDFSTGVHDHDFARVMADPRARLLECDLATPEAADLDIEGVEVFYHLAAKVGVARVLDQPFEVLRDNIATTETALDLAGAADVSRFVFASSSEVYAGSQAADVLPFPTPESAPVVIPDLSQRRPAYLLSKLCGEALTRYSGVPWTILRFHNVYGPRMGHSHVVPELLDRTLNAPSGGDLRVRSSDHQRTFCYVADAVEFIVRAASSPSCEGEVLNVGASAPEVRMDELAKLISDATDKRINIVPAPADVGSPTRRAPDMTRATELTGYRAQVSLEEGLVYTTTWYSQRDANHA